MNRILLLALVVAGCLFSSCARFTDEQAAQLSQGKSDVVAARSTSDQSARNALYAAAGARLMAGVFDVDLPPPAVSPQELVAADFTPIQPAVDREVQESRAAEKDPPAGGGAWAWVGAGGLALLGLIRFTPGVSGMAADLAYNLLAPKMSREVDRKAHELYQHGAAVVQYGVEMAHVAEAVAPDQAKLVQDKAIAIQAKLGIADTVKALVEAAKARAKATQA